MLPKAFRVSPCLIRKYFTTRCYLNLGKQALLGKICNLNLDPFLRITTDRKGCCYHARGQSATAMLSSRRVVTCLSKWQRQAVNHARATAPLTAETCFSLIARPASKPYKCFTAHKHKTRLNYHFMHC